MATANYGLEKMDYGTTGQNAIHDNNMDIIDDALPDPDHEVKTDVAGSATFSQPFQMDYYKVVLIYLDGFDGAATYTFPTAFTNIPMIIGEDEIASRTIITSLTETQVVLDGDAETGFIQLVGF